MSKNIFHSSILLILAVFAPGVVSAAGLPYPIHQPLTRRGPILSNAAVLDPRQADDLELQAALDDVLARLGLGYNSFTNETGGDCVKGFVVGPHPTSFAPSFDIKLVETFEEFTEETSAEASVSGGFGSFSASIETRYEQASKKSNNTQFLLVRVKVIAAPDINLKDRVLAVEPAGNDPEALRRFFNQCGDRFISKIEMGGAFIAVLSFVKSDSDVKSSLNISGSAGGFTASGSADFNRQLSSLRSESSLTISATQLGGDSASGLPEFNLDSLINYARDFPKKINSATVVPVGMTAEPYVSLGLDLPDLGDVKKNFEAVAARASEAQGHLADLQDLQALLSRNRIPMLHSENDITARTAAAILATRNDVKAMNAALASCARAFWMPDKCSFDPRHVDYQLPTPAPLFIRQIDTRSANGVTIDIPGKMTVELRGDYCWTRPACDKDGVYSGGDPRVNINWPGGGDVYRGQPMAIPVGPLTIATHDTDYGDNSGELFAFVY